MKHKFDIRSLLCGAMLGAAIVITVAAADAKRTSWEYTVIPSDTSYPNTAAFTKLGNEGWEMVGSYGGPEGKYPGFVFKRQR